MDPKTANLDPKLREAYERIMGTSVPPPAQKTASQVQNTTKPTENTPFQVKMKVSEVKPEPLNVPVVKPPLPPLPTQAPPSNEMVQSPVFNATLNHPQNEQAFMGNAALGQNTNLNQETPKKKGSLKPVFITIGVILFLGVYAVIWAKVFNLF